MEGLIALGLGYAFGSIPFGLILTSLSGAGDLRSIGSGNIGATNVLRTGRKGIAAATLLLDLLKALAAVTIARSVLPGCEGLAALVGAVATAAPTSTGLNTGLVERPMHSSSDVVLPPTISTSTFGV